MKKALIVVNLAGFLTFLWNDIELLQRMGFEVSVAMNGHMKDGSDAREIPILDAKGIQHYQVDFDTKSPASRQNMEAYKQLKNILSEGFDLIHCHTPIAGVLVRLAARKYRKKGTKVIYTTHGFAFTDRSSKKSWLVFYNMEKLASKFCDAIITINHEDFYNAKKMHCKNVYIIPGVGLDCKIFENAGINRSEYRSSLGLSDDDTVIIAVGELSDRKNHQIIIKALSKVHNKGKYAFVLCGRSVVNSGMEEKLKNLAESCGVRLILTGHRFDIPQLNKCADISVIPSVREGLGMAGLEALASGLPVIGSDVQGIREYVINGKTGYLCNPFSEDEFAAAIEKLSAADENEKAIMRKNCIETAGKFDKKYSQKEMERIYNLILKPKETLNNSDFPHKHQ